MMAERTTDEYGYVWERNWAGDWVPVKDWMGNHVDRDAFGFKQRGDDSPRNFWGERIDPREAEDKGCFLTTATVHHRGLPDDCRELEAMRRLRDEYLLHAGADRELVAEYYELAPRIIAEIEHHGEQRLYEEIYGELQKAVSLVEAGKMEEARELALAGYLRLKERFLGSES